MSDFRGLIGDPVKVASRARRLFGIRGGASGAEGAEIGGAQEAMMVRAGPPDATDRKAIAARILATTAGRPDAPTAKEAAGIAGELVNRAKAGMTALADGALDWRLGGDEAYGLEAVIHVRGRPAVRVYDDDLEDLAVYPGASLWQAAVDMHRGTILGVCASTGAVCVRDGFVPNAPWVQGTAWLVAPDLALTNRHVLFPPLGGTAIARRIPGSTAARMKQDYGITLDFAFDNGMVRETIYRVLEVPFVSEERDPIDAALLKVEKLSGPSAIPMPVSRESVFELERLYVVGHPGRLTSVPEKVRAVFGDPDERKRVSFGLRMEADHLDPDELIHDASTIGGYSGGCVLGFLANQVRALHYWGDPEYGNRAITASALRRHPVLGPMLETGG